MDAVLFDMDDTLYDQALPFAHAVREVMGALPDGADADALYRASRRHSGEVFAAFGRGERPTDEAYVRRMRETMADFGVDVTDDVALRLQHAYASAGGATVLSGDMASALDWCAAHVTRGLGVVTNGTRERQMGKYRALGLGRWMREGDVVVSDEEGVAKPDPRIFSRACDLLGARARSSLFVGDSYQVDVVGARAAGLRVVWLDRRGGALPEGAGRPGGPPLPDWVVRTDAELRDLLARVVR